ncbi:hypothetical protein GCM10010371_66300 [Streptomyces subrutilus]|uniref:Lipocalin-like domain-containing protein n=2 Tax=Streptomyces subrutilus TaxID=36818 RepID=A0A5P2UEP5_9ACTN|nr:hypothetical protein CP968_00045 [Streptomyces subrutilus]GGZ97170.1 hypothetical protein GCM10010371_66300 [Streptomyces subrutilus]
MRGWRAMVLVVSGVVLTASCGYGAAVHAAEIPQEQLIGTWTSPAGTSLTFSKEHTFTGTGFDKVEAMADCAHPERLSNGRWAFYVSPEGDGLIVPDETATRGHDLQLSFSEDPTCTVWVYLYGYFGDTEDPGMCPTEDPDAGCPPDGYMERSAASTSS